MDTGTAWKPQGKRFSARLAQPAWGLPMTESQRGDVEEREEEKDSPRNKQIERERGETERAPCGHKWQGFGGFVHQAGFGVLST